MDFSFALYQCWVCITNLDWNSSFPGFSHAHISHSHSLLSSIPWKAMTVLITCVLTPSANWINMLLSCSYLLSIFHSVYPFSFTRLPLLVGLNLMCHTIYFLFSNCPRRRAHLFPLLNCFELYFWLTKRLFCIMPFSSFLYFFFLCPHVGGFLSLHGNLRLATKI